jgi:phospholipid-translocating ATPase
VALTIEGLRSAGI